MGEGLEAPAEGPKSPIHLPSQSRWEKSNGSNGQTAENSVLAGIMRIIQWTGLKAKTADRILCSTQ